MLLIALALALEVIIKPSENCLSRYHSVDLPLGWFLLFGRIGQFRSATAPLWLKIYLLILIRGAATAPLLSSLRRSLFGEGLTTLRPSL